MTLTKTLIYFGINAISSLLGLFTLILVGRCTRNRGGTWGALLVYMGVFVGYDLFTWGLVITGHSTWNVGVFYDLALQVPTVVTLGFLLQRMLPRTWLSPGPIMALYGALGATCYGISQDLPLTRCLLGAGVFLLALGTLVALCLWDEVRHLPVYRTMVFWVAMAFIVQFSGQVAHANVLHLVTHRGPISIFWINFAIGAIPNGLAVSYLALATRRGLYA